MKKLLKRTHTAILLTIIGGALVSLNFFSYIMNNIFISILSAAVGVVLLIIGSSIVHQSKRAR